MNLGDHIESWRIQRTPAPDEQQEAVARPTTWTFELELVLILPATPKRGPPFGLDAFPSVAFSADGRKLAAGYGAAIVWEVGAWREIWRTYSGVFGRGFVFTDDGRHIISNGCSWELPKLDEPEDSAATETAVQVDDRGSATH